jgi:hypothetical protein
MNKWDLINIMREQFSDEELTDMLVYWLSNDELERCIKDYLNDRDLEIKNGYIRQKEDDEEKVIYRLETHLYAPELNKIHLTNGDMISAPGITTIEKAEELIIKRKLK